MTVEAISPWRFDAARNRPQKLVDGDADICVCTDLDEVFHPGWRAVPAAAEGGEALYKFFMVFNTLFKFQSYSVLFLWLY